MWTSVHAHNGVVTPKSTQRKQKPLKKQTKTAFHLPHLRGHSHEIFCCLSSSHTHTPTHIGSRISRATERSAAAATARGKQEQRGDAATRGRRRGECRRTRMHTPVRVARSAVASLLSQGVRAYTALLLALVHNRCNRRSSNLNHCHEVHRRAHARFPLCALRLLVVHRVFQHPLLLYLQEV